MDTFLVLIVVFIVVLIWRGPKTLPQLGAMLGRGVRGAREEVERMRAGETGEPRGPDRPTGD